MGSNTFTTATQCAATLPQIRSRRVCSGKQSIQCCEKCPSTYPPSRPRQDKSATVFKASQNFETMSRSNTSQPESHL